MSRAQSAGAWKRSNRSVEHLAMTPGSEEFRPGPAGLVSGHEHAVDGYVAAVIGVPRPPGRTSSPASASVLRSRVLS
jgi:hypothetical protein